jgi:hypothetical protein
MAMMREMRELSENSGTSIINEKMLAVFSNMLDMVTRFNQSQNPGEGTNWMEVIREVVDKAGTAVSTFGNVQARKAAAAQAQANAQAVTAAAGARMAEANARRLPAAPAPAASAPATAKPIHEQQRDELAAAMDRAEGKPTVPPAAAPVTAAADAPATVTPIKRGKKAAPAALVPNPIISATIAQLRETFDDVDDATFFGPFADKIEELRGQYSEDPSQVAPDDVANYVMEARPYFVEVLKTSGGKPPLAIEMLGHGKFAYLFERMLPEADEAFWSDAAAALQLKVSAERAAKPTG